MKLIDSMELIDSDVRRALPRRASAKVSPISALRGTEPRGPAGPGTALLRAAVAAGLLGPGTLLAQAPEPPDDIEEVIVTSSRIPTPLRQIGTAVSVIEADEIRIRGYHSMADVLRTQPGIGVSNAGGAGKTTSLRIRGEDGYRTLVMIDGVDVSDPTGTQVGPSFDNLLTTSDIERVEILRGPQGFVYGADAGGVVNILTRRGEGPPAGQVAVELGDFDTRRTEASVSGGGESADYFLSVTDLDSNGFNTQVSDTVLADDDGYENTTLHGKIGWTPTEALRLQLVGRDIEAVTEFDTCGFPTTADCIGRTDQTTFRLSADYRAGAFTHLLAYSGTDVARDNLAAGAPSFATSGDLNRAEYTGSFRPSESTTLVYGLDLEHEDVIASDGSELDQRQIGYYFEYQKAIDDRIFFTAGARHDDNDDFGTHTSVRATAAYVTDVGAGALKYRASYGTGFRAPSPSELAYNAGPSAFPPAAGLSLGEESSKGFDIGVEYTADSGLYLEATWFDQRIEDEIFFDVAGFSGYLQSIGTSRSQGLELAAEVPVGMRWQLLANFTYNDTEDADGEQRVRRPERLANVGARFSSADERFRVIANYRMSRDAVDELFGIGRIPLEDYEVLDLSAAYTIGERVDVFARLQNVTDEEYQEITGFNTPGSSASAGVRVRF